MKLKAQDGKNRVTDTLDTKGILRLIESVPSPKVALTDLDEIATRELAGVHKPYGLE